MTKKRNLTTFMIAIMIMLFSLPVNAEGTVGYVEWNGVNTLTFKGGESVPKDAYELNTDSIQPGWNSVASSCTKVKFDESFKDVRPTSCFYWFKGFSKLSTIEGIGYLNTDNVTTMCAMFYNCSGLTTLDLSSFNTDEVTDMSGMFWDCSSLTSLDLSSFNTAEVTYMGYMFYGCSSITSLDLSSFNTANVTNMDDMFNGCSGLTTIYVSDAFKIDNVTKYSNMFSGCSNLIGATSYSNSGITDKSMANYKTGYFTKSNLTPYVKWDANTKVLTFKVGSWGQVRLFTL